MLVTADLHTHSAYSFDADYDPAQMLAAAADEEAKEKLLAAPIAGMELEMMVKGTRAALEACLPSLPL